MNDNKLVSGGIVFALTSLATFSYHQLVSSQQRRKRYPEPMRPIQEHEISKEEITPSNTPLSENSEDQKDASLEVYSDRMLITQSENFAQEFIEKMVDSIAVDHQQTHSNTMSSFLELRNTGSLTNTEELEFTHIEQPSPQNNVYGTPNPSIAIKLTNNLTELETQSEKQYESDKSEEIEVSYYSEGELLNNKRSKTGFMNFLKTLKKRKSL